MRDAETSSTSELAASGPVVLFDGVCNFCNGAIQFIVDRERAPRLRFAALQSTVAQRLLEDTFGSERATQLLRGVNGSGSPDSIVLIESGRGFTHSEAALRIARHLRAPYRWAFVLIAVPRLLRDAVYRFIAERRYRWFGRSETCRVPTPELRRRFLS